MTSCSKQGSLDFIVFSDDWGLHPSSCQHLFGCIAKAHRVLWVNTIGMRHPKFNLQDFKKTFQKIHRWLKPIRSEKRKRESVAVYSPWMMPWHDHPWIYQLNTHSLKRRLNKILNGLKFGSPILVTTVPHLSLLFEQLEKRRLVYYRVDDFSVWPGLEGSFIQNEEERLLKSADAVVASSEVLASDIKKVQPQVRILEHGVDVEHFKLNRDKTISPSYLKCLSRPIVGFYGLIDERIDQDLMKYLSHEKPDWSFVLVGEVATHIGKMSSCKNIYFPGEVSYEHLPLWGSSFDVCIIPYVVSSQTHGITPLKLMEYLALGKGVVSTPLPSVNEREGIVAVAKDGASFTTAVQSFLEMDVSWQDRRRNAALSNSWSQKAEQFVSFLEEIL